MKISIDMKRSLVLSLSLIVLVACTTKSPMDKDLDNLMGQLTLEQ